MYILLSLIYNYEWISLDDSACYSTWKTRTIWSSSWMELFQSHSINLRCATKEEIFVGIVQTLNKNWICLLLQNVHQFTYTCNNLVILSEEAISLRSSEEERRYLGTISGKRDVWHCSRTRVTHRESPRENQPSGVGAVAETRDEQVCARVQRSC